MGRRCVFKGCTYGNGEAISLFKFPRHEALRQAWVEYVIQYLSDWSGPTFSSVLCAAHFAESSFDFGVELQRQFGLTSKRRLRTDAIPSVPIPENILDTEFFEGNVKRGRKRKSVDDDVLLSGDTDLGIVGTEITVKTESDSENITFIESQPNVTLSAESQIEGSEAIIELIAYTSEEETGNFDFTEGLSPDKVQIETASVNQPDSRGKKNTTESQAKENQEIENNESLEVRPRPNTRSRGKIKIRVDSPTTDDNDGEKRAIEDESNSCLSPRRRTRSSGGTNMVQEKSCDGKTSPKKLRTKKKGEEAIGTKEAASLLLDLRSNTPGSESQTPSPGGIESDIDVEDEAAIVSISPESKCTQTEIPFITTLLTTQKELQEAVEILRGENANLKEQLAKIEKDKVDRHCQRCSADLAVDNAVRSLALQNALSQQYIIAGGLGDDVVTLIPQFLPGAQTTVVSKTPVGNEN